jgi:tetrapyrrole methylase family protein/MazG family protein
MATYQYRIDDLLEIMARLRGPDGCPWDREQTHRSIKGHLIEECYELAEAIDSEDFEGMKEELGDLLLHVIFHAQMAKEQQKFGFSEIVQNLAEKLIRRHPHVFADQSVSSAKEVISQWQLIKKREKPERQGPLDGIPRGLPPIQRAVKLQKVASEHRLDWENVTQVVDKLGEEISELIEAIKSSTPEDIEEELGDLFFTLINLARHLKIDAESAISTANQKFEKRLLQFIGVVYRDNLVNAPLSTEEIEKLWQAVKSY